MATTKADDAKWAFKAYEKVRDRLPSATFPQTSKMVESLTDIADQFDVFLLDAFGVLNIGETAIPGAPERVAALQEAGKTVMVLSNAAGVPKRLLMEKYARIGYNFADANVVSSREVLLQALQSRPPCCRGLMASLEHGFEELEHLNAEFLGEDPEVYDRVDEFLFIGSGEWTDDHQSLLETSLCANPRPVLVGNPDIVAPRETGLSREAGLFAHRVADNTGVVPEFFGKPFANAFELAFSRLPEDVDPNRVVMVGDTLQTDILGGAAAGVKTALITDFGSLTGLDVGAAIWQSGITPDFVMPAP